MSELLINQFNRPQINDIYKYNTQPNRNKSDELISNIIIKDKKRISEYNGIYTKMAEAN